MGRDAGEVCLLSRRAVLASLLVLVLGWGTIQEAASQEAGTEALGTPIGAFLIYPSLTVATEYNDNIFATNTDEEDDVIFTITPEVSVQTDWDVHSLEFLASTTLKQYVDHTGENTLDYRFLSSGRVDILEDTFATLSAGISRHHEERGSADDVFGEEPTAFTTMGGSAGFSHRFNRVWTELNGSVTYLNYDDVDAAGGGTFNNTDRDRVEYGSSARVGYDFNPDIGAFVEGSFNLVDYDEPTDDNGFDRNSYDYGLAVGMRFDITELLFGDAFVGVTRSEFDDSRFASTTTFDVGSDLTWEATPLTSVNLSASRTWEETTVAGASSALTTNAALSVNHSLLDTVTLTAFLDYTHESFEEINRVDETVSTGPGVSYLMNRFAHLNLNYTYTQRFSDLSTEDYVEHSIILSVRLQY
jgi:hypothetical protein